MGRFRTLLNSQDYLVLHGALGTELEFQGHDVSGKLWSAKYLICQPDLIQVIHETYVRAGVDIITTASYQATIPGLINAGLTEVQANTVIQQTVKLALNARKLVWEELPLEEKNRRVYPLISGCVGPYAAYLANGSEYSGDYGELSLVDLKNFHRPRITLLIEAGVELLCLETIPNALEVRALVELLADEFPQVEAYMSFTAQNSSCISDGTALEDVIPLVDSSSQILAIGFNCTSPFLFDDLLKQVVKWTNKPLVTYPNSGEVYDGASQTWKEKEVDNSSLLTNTIRWRQLGAKIVGGCCRTRPSDIISLVSGLRESQLTD